jgi:hypothetical protein
MSDIISQLAQLKPVPMDRDALIFQAGRASAPGVSPAWKWACAAFAPLLVLTTTLAIVNWESHHTPKISLPVIVPISENTKSESPTIAITPAPEYFKTESPSGFSFFGIQSVDYSQPIRPSREPLFMDADNVAIRSASNSKSRISPVRHNGDFREPIHAMNGQLVNP